MNIDNGLQSEIVRAAALFQSFDPVKPIKIISHLDADGITACSILIRTLMQESRKYSVSIVHQLDKEKLEAFALENYEYHMFTDLGSGSLAQIERSFKGKKVIILDHHTPEDHSITSPDFVVVNPHLHGIDGSKTISGSGIVFLFSRTLNKKYEDMAHLAIIGAIGDMQESGGFSGLNKEILELAVQYKKMEIVKGLRCFGQQSRPIHKVLEYSSEPHIPGVSGSESGAIQFLMQLGIEPKSSLGWRKASDLSHEEMQNLIAGILIRRGPEGKSEDVIGNKYILTEERPDSLLRDAREFTTLLNACGRMDKASLGIGICLGDKETIEKAIKNQNSYRKEIVKALDWFEQNRKSDKVLGGKGYVIINAEDNVLHTIIGTLASILAKGNDVDPDTYILSMARNPAENHTKISLRYSGTPKGADLHSILSTIIEKTGGETGGHANAAGAVIKTEKELEFIEIARAVLEKSSA